jgi:hypothetical protein
MGLAVGRVHQHGPREGELLDQFLMRQWLLRGRGSKENWPGFQPDISASLTDRYAMSPWWETRLRPFSLE